MTNIILSLSNISKSFHDGSQNLQILNNINLKVEQGEIVSLVGSSGSGKTSLLQIIGLIDTATSGTLEFENKNNNLNAESSRTKFRRDKLGFIFQFHYLLPEFTAKENVAFPLFIQGVKKKQALVVASDLLSKIGLNNRENHRPGELSGGEKQRVAIARGLIHKPILLLADEPTGNLDPSNAEKIMAIFLEYVKLYKQTSLIVTHNMNIAKQTDRILSIKDKNLEEITI